MPETPNNDPFVFSVETYFQKMARRPGGMPREEVIELAQTKLDEFRPEFDEWLNNRLQELNGVIEELKSSSSGGSAWNNAAYLHSRALRDVGATMGFELLSFIANNLCEIFEENTDGIDRRIDMIECHMKALLLARQEQYRHLRPTDLPELTDGLRRLSKAAPYSPPKATTERLG